MVVPDVQGTGLTLSIVTYLSSGGKVGDKLKGTAVCEKSEAADPSTVNITTRRLMLSTVGKTLAFTNVTFWDKERNLVARGSHTKSVHLPSRQGCC
jgi:acyl-coenzyme A thioesterase 13